jgi:hypothetical protein
MILYSYSGSDKSMISDFLLVSASHKLLMNHAKILFVCEKLVDC